MSDEFEMEVVENDELDSYTPPDSSSEADVAAGGELEREQSTGHGRSKMQTANSGTVQLGPKELSIPSVWNLTTFEEANESEKPIGYGVVKPGPHIEDGIPLIRITDVIDGRLEADQDFHRISDELDEQYSRSRLDGGELLVSIQGTVGEVVVAPPQLDGANISRTLARITPGEGLNTHWVKYFLESKEAQDYMEVVSSGSTRASYNIGDIRKTKLPVPPLPEQRKIASVLYAVDQAIQKTEAIIEQAQRVKRGLMQDMMRNGLQKHDREETETRFGTLPRSWEVKRLKELGKIAGRTAPEKEDSECWGGDIPWATPSEITNLEGNTISKTEEYLTERALEKVSSNLLPPWSVLLTTRATVGACAVNTVPMTTNQGFKNVIPGEDLDTWYAYYRLVYEADQLEARAKGSTFREVGKETVENFEIPVPPREEQQRIGEILKSIDDAILNNKETVSEYERLKKGLMQDLLTGEVRTAGKAIDLLDEVVSHG